MVHREPRRIRSIGKALASLKLAIACLCGLMALVVACTLAQVDLGTWRAVEVTMRSWLVWARLPRTGLSIPVFPGGALLGLLLGASLLAAQLSRLELSARKAGIWLVHAGLILLVAGEFTSGALQQDMRMPLEVGETRSYLESPRELELAIVDSTDPGFDDVHAVPESLLAGAGSRPIAIPGTPISLRVKRYLPNAELRLRRNGDPPSLATAGVGSAVAVAERPRFTADDEVNLAAVWVEPVAAGRSLGVWLVSNALRPLQPFVHAGRTWSLSMRARRAYLPYALTLKEFRHDLHPGTDIPRNFSSLVHLSSRSTGEERDVLISMNQPLRYGGQAFYQQSFGRNDTLSVLQVVRNPGWLLPYLSAALVAAGLLLHFTLTLRRGGGRRSASAMTPAGAPLPRAQASAAARAAPWVAGGLALAGALAAALPPGPVRGFDLEAFGALPVLEGGRVKPIDSVARNSLLLLSGRQGLRHAGRPVGPDEWLLDAMFRPEVADAQAVFLVDDPEVLGLMGLRQSSQRRFSLAELAPHVGEIQRQAEAARRIEARERTRFQGAVVALFDRLHHALRLRNTVEVSRSRGLAEELARASRPEAAAHQARLASLALFRALPPAAGGDPGAWKSVGEALGATARGEADPALAAWARISSAYKAQDAGAFGRAVADLRRAAGAAAPGAPRAAGLEVIFNRAQPFQAGMAIYLLALLLLFASWAWKPALLRPAAFGLVAAAALVHTAGLACRIALQGRPPVTNLYSSAVFVGWAAVMLGLAVERQARRGFGIAVAAASGFATLIVAHHLTGSGDTMEMMRAVLDSNFWLATHVVAITIGYSGTFLAGALAVGWVLRSHLVRRPDPATTRSLVSTTYGVVCFALLFSFVGTVLGGIWADQSWGRFWGWDPKENGALLIVLWNAVILHARWAGYVREKGIMAMAIFGNVITSLSWFGVNMLGVGLHSYGFMDRAFWSLAAFIASQLALLALALAPPLLLRVRTPAAQQEPARARRGKAAAPPARRPAQLPTR